MTACESVLFSPVTVIVRVWVPLLTVVEAKNDNLRTGLGQCIAAMTAALLLNQGGGQGSATVYGAVTTGGVWKFLRLAGPAVTLDLVEYHIDNLGKIMGILDHILRAA